MFIYMYNKLRLQLFLRRCFQTNISAEKMYLLKFIIVQINIKCYDLFAWSTCEELCGKVLWLATSRCTRL